MKKIKHLSQPASFWVITSIIVLTIQNIIIFYSHYFKNLSFPWDFPMDYYSWVAFWTAAIEKGIFPAWVPFQSMGYPFVIQLQAALFYPPFWVFPLFSLDYTFQTAVAVQCLHVLAGSIGMFLLLRLKVRDIRLALLGAVMFQFFGGFYGNAQHADIVRSFALTPWALYCFTFSDVAAAKPLRTDQKGTGVFRKSAGWIKRLFATANLPLRAYFIPLLIFFFATGGYPGNFFALLFVLAIYVAAQLTAVFLENRSLPQLLSAGLFLFVLTFLGISMSAVQLGPSWLFRGEFSRLATFDSLEKEAIWIPQFPGLFLSSKTLPGEISITSTFVTLPALIFACFLCRSTIKKHWPIAIIGLVSLLMIGGNNTFFYRWVTKLVFPLALSRFPTSDYRALVAVPLIIFAMFGLEDLLQTKWKPGSLLVRFGFIGLWFFQGIYMAYWFNPLVERLGTKDVGYLLFSWAGLHTRTSHILSAVAVLLLTLGLVLLLSRSKHGLKTISLILLIGLVFIDGMRVITDMSTWKDPYVYENYYVDEMPLYVNNAFSPRRIFDHLPTSRPERQFVENPHLYAWRGYIDGSYQMRDYSKCPTNACAMVEANPIYFQYMLKAWQPILLTDGWKVDGSDQVTIADEIFSEAANSMEKNPGEVVQTFYGLNAIRYQVNLQQPKLMVENETFFPGWKATLRSGASSEVITAIKSNQAFRAWQLPAGSYEMEAAFHFPYFDVLVAVSAISCVFWLALLSLRIFLFREVSQQVDLPLPSPSAGSPA